MGIFDFLKPKIDIVINKLKNTDLHTQGLLLEKLKNSRKWKSGESLTYIKDWYTQEHNNLVSRNLSIKMAEFSLDRWKRAKKICNNNNFIKGEQFFENFVTLYSNYINTKPADTETVSKILEQAKAIQDESTSEIDTDISNDRILGSDFKNIKELITYIETNKDIKVKVEAEEYWGGWYQLKNSKKCQGVIVKEIYDSSGDLAIKLKEKNGKQIVEFGDGYDEGYDSNKQLKDGKFHIWGIAEISKENILKMLREFGEEESFDSDFLDFINYHIHNCNEIDEAYELLNISEFEVGKGEDFGVDDISWSVEEDINNFSMELVINNPNPTVH